LPSGHNFITFVHAGGTGFALNGVVVAGNGGFVGFEHVISHVFGFCTGTPLHDGIYNKPVSHFGVVVGHAENSHRGPVRPTYVLPSGHSFASIVHATGVFPSDLHAVSVAKVFNP
jgi:hypothetical protein